MLIWKENLPTDTLDICEVELPFADIKSAKQHILNIDMQYNKPVMWFQADDDSDGKVKKKKSFIIMGIGTGHPYTDDKCREIVNRNSYIGTSVLAGGTLVLHYFISNKEEFESIFTDI